MLEFIRRTWQIFHQGQKNLLDIRKILLGNAMWKRKVCIICRERPPQILLPHNKEICFYCLRDKVDPKRQKRWLQNRRYIRTSDSLSLWQAKYAQARLASVKKLAETYYWDSYREQPE